MHNGKADSETFIISVYNDEKIKHKTGLIGHYGLRGAESHAYLWLYAGLLCFY